jgi:hypothetical protein
MRQCRFRKRIGGEGWGEGVFSEPGSPSSGLSATFSPGAGEKGQFHALMPSPGCLDDKSLVGTWRCPTERISGTPDGIVVTLRPL